MAHVAVVEDAPALESPTLVEGLPGDGLVGKLVADHLFEACGMEYYAGVYCDGVPDVATYRADDSKLRPPVQVHADVDRDVLVLVSDVGISPGEAPEFASCLVDWFLDRDVMPVFLAASPREDAAASEPREVFGVSTGEGDAILDGAGIVPPREAGYVTGPTGAMLSRAAQVGLDGVGLVTGADADTADLEAAEFLLVNGVEPVLEVCLDSDVASGPLLEDDIGVSRSAEAFAEVMRSASDRSTRATATTMFQ